MTFSVDRSSLPRFGPPLGAPNARSPVDSLAASRPASLLAVSVQDHIQNWPFRTLETHARNKSSLLEGEDIFQDHQSCLAFSDQRALQLDRSTCQMSVTSIRGAAAPREQVYVLRDMPMRTSL
jgi:hypothetical protein